MCYVKQRLPLTGIRKELPNLRTIFISFYCFDKLLKLKRENNKSYNIQMWSSTPAILAHGGIEAKRL
jgi:hypothetical protein